MTCNHMDACGECYDRITELEAENMQALADVIEIDMAFERVKAERDKLQVQLLEVREIYAGMDGGNPQTLEGKYLHRMIKQMYQTTLGAEPDAK
jgi:hypothetical protein